MRLAEHLALALCSLNWADILAGYCRDAPELAALREPMLAAYNSALAFLQPAPSMPMPDLTSLRPISPIAALGQNRRMDINRQLKLRGDETLLLMGLGWTCAPTAGGLAGAAGCALRTPPAWEVAGGYGELGGAGRLLNARSNPFL